MKILIGGLMLTLLLGLASFFHFSPAGPLFYETKSEFFIPGQTSEWWVCAYCGTYHEDSDSSCNCPRRQGKYQ
jgi:hypothetical protein